MNSFGSAICRMPFLRRGTGDELRENLQVDVGERLDVHASLPELVLAERCEEPCSTGCRIQTINADITLSRREPHEARVSFTTAFVPVVIASEADNTRAPHLRRMPRGPGHQGCQ